MYSYLFPVTMMAFIFSAGMSAQETTVSVKVEKDGKVVKDTTYSFEDADQAEHALMMMDLMGSDDEVQSKTMVFISEDGKTTEISEMSGDSLVWISEGEHHHDGDVKRVVVVKSGDGETYDILIDEDVKDEDGNIVKTKEVKVIVSSESDGEWTVTEETDEEIVVKKKSKKQ